MRNLLDYKLLGFGIGASILTVVLGMHTHFEACESCKPCGWIITVGMALLSLVFLVFARVFRK